MLATPPFGASSNKALLRANIKPPVELVVADLDNALKYSTGDIMFYMWGESEYCHIQISNPSDYISDEELKSIFDLFYTKDEARTKSSGIGLYATRKLVIQISGDIQVNYEAGIFTVSIKLPLI